MINRIAVADVQEPRNSSSISLDGKIRLCTIHATVQPINFWSAAIRSRSACSRSVDSVMSVTVI